MAVKTGYWRKNKLTGEIDWIEGSYQPPQSDYDVRLEELSGLIEELEPPPPPPLEEVQSALQTMTLEEWKEAYGRWYDLPESAEERAALLTQVEPYKTPEGLYDVRAALEARVPLETLFPLFGEEYITNLMATMSLPVEPLPPEPLPLEPPPITSPYMVYDYEANQFVYVSEEEYLKREQFYQQYPGVAPPGTPGKITPKELKEQRIDELTISLLPAFPEMFVAGEEPSLVIEQLVMMMERDFETFLALLYKRVGEFEADKILRELGVGEDVILASLDFKKQEEKVTRGIQAVFPDYGIEEFSELLGRDPDLVIDTLLAMGRTPETEDLLRILGKTDADIDEFFVEAPIAPAEKPLVAEVQNVVTGEVIPQSELKLRYPRGSEPELDQWVLTQETMMRLPSVGKVFLQALTKVPKQVAAAFLQAVQGMEGASVVDKNWAARWIGEAKTGQAEFVAGVAEMYGEAGLPFSPTEIAQLPQNIAFSMTSMAAGLGVGLPIAAIPLPGARVAAWTAGTIASGAVAYRMTTYQIMQEYLEAKNEEQIARTGKGLTQEEEDRLKSEFQSLATQYGLWEALPEAISNLGFAAILTKPLTRVVGKAIATRIIGKLGLLYGEEMLTETITQKGQSAVEIEAGLRAKKLTWREAFKEVAPQTFLLTTVMGGAGQLSISSYNKIRSSLQKEVGADTSLYQLISGELKEGMQALITETEAMAPGKKVPKGELPKGQVPKELPKEVPSPKVPEVTPEVTQFAPEYIETLKSIKGTSSSDFTIKKTTGAGLANWRAIDKASGIDIGGGNSRRLAEEVVNRVVANKAKLAIPKAEPVTPEVRLQEFVIKRDPIKSARGLGYEVQRLSPKRSIDASDYAEGYRFRLIKPVEGQPIPDIVMAKNEKEIADFLLRQRVKPPAPKVSVTPKVTKIEPSYENLTEGQTLVNQAGERWTITGIKKEGVPARWAYTIKIDTPRMKLTRTVPLGEIERYYKIEQPAIPTAEAAQTWTEAGIQPSMLPEEVAGRVMQLREEKRQLKEHEQMIKRQMTERPLPALTEMSEEEVKENWAVIGKKIKYNMAQIDALNAVFAEYIENPSTLTAWELTRELRRESRAGRAENLKARTQELIITQGVAPEEAMNQAIKEALSSELPVETTAYLKGFTKDMRDALFAKVYHVLKNDPFEMASTVTALTNALTGKPIPREPGVRGGSAFTRLQRVFGKQPKVLKALDTMGKENKPLKEVVEAVFRGHTDPIPVDPETTDYLRGLAEIPFGQVRIGEERFEYLTVEDPRTLVQKIIDMRKAGLIKAPEITQQAITYLTSISNAIYDQIGLTDKPSELAFKIVENFPNRPSDLKITDARSYVQKIIEMRQKGLLPAPPLTKYEFPIEEALKQIPLMPRPAKDNMVRVLKEIGMSPVDFGNFLRANKASFDFSFWRQQAPLIASHPISFVQANVEAWKALWSQKSAEASWERITRDPLYQIYEEAILKGGDFLRPLELKKGTSQWRGVEEFGYLTGERLLPRLTAKLPWVKLSARAFETGTNVHNWLIFKNYYKAMLRLNEMYATGKKKLKPGEAFDITHEMVDFSKSLGNFSGRGSLGKFAATAPELSGLFFAPRLAIGRILSVADLVNANPRVRLEAWKNASLFVSTFGGMVLLGAMMGWWSVEKDPRNAEYMSIRIGNTRIDPWGGYRQFLVFFTRAITQTGVSSVTGVEYEVDPINLIQTFIRGKASPLASLLLDFWRGKNFIGEKVDVTDIRQWAERVAPFALWDIYEAFMDDPIHALQATIPAIVGAGVQTYTGDWAENFRKLGLPKYSDNLPYGLLDPRYDTADFWADTAFQFKGVDPATLTKEKGFPEYIRAMVEARLVKEYLETLPNEKLVSLNADPAKGLTFADYYRQWGDREKLVADGDNAVYVRSELQPDGTYKEITYKGEEALKVFDQDERTRNAHLGNFSQRQFALLNDYWAITDKKEKANFLEEHPELTVNPRQEWLKSHPTENAKLAVWGQAKLLTKAAYNEFKRMVDELDIPDNAIPPMLGEKSPFFQLPEQSVDNYLAYQDMENKNSWEAQLMLAKDDELREFLGRQPIDTPIASLELKVKNRANFDKLDTFSDRDSPDYIADAKERAEAIKKFRADNPGFVDDTRQIEAIEKGGLKVTRDTKLASFDEAKKWLEHDKLGHIDKKGKALDEWSQHWLDNYDFILKTLSDIQAGKINADDINKSLEILDRDIFHDEPSEGWDKFFAKQEPIPGIPPETRPGYFERTVEEFRRISALLRSKLPEGIPASNYFIDRHVAYGKLIDKEGIGSSSAEVMLYRVDNPDYDKWRQDADIWGDNALKPVDQSKIPIWRIDVKYRKEDAEYQAILDKYPDRPPEEMAEAKAYLAANEEYRQDKRRRDAYQLTNSKTGYKFPTTEVENYVAYNELPIKGFRRERFLIENPSFLDALYKVGEIADVPDPVKVPAVQYDDIYDQFPDLFDEIENNGKPESEWFEPDPIKRAARDEELRFDLTGKLTEFGLAEIKRNGYGNLVPELYINDYVGYYTIVKEGKPAGYSEDLSYYEDDWFLMEHMDFYRDVYLGVLGNQRKDFRKVPSREVYKKYLIYLQLPDQSSKKEYRYNNPDLDEWGVIYFGWTPIFEQKKQEEEQEKPKKKPKSRAGLTYEERLQELEEELAGLR